MVNKLPIHIPHERAFRHTLFAALLLFGGGVYADDPQNCLLCHQYRGLSRFDSNSGRVHVFFVDPDYVHGMKGPHARLACTDCHQADQVDVIPHGETTPVDCTQTCHLSEPDGLKHEFSHVRIDKQLGGSVHDSKHFNALQFTGGPLLDPGQSECLYCHDEPVFQEIPEGLTFFDSLGGKTRDRCQSCHADMPAIDISYYMRHIAARLQPARPTLELAQVCAVCHSDPQVLEHTRLHNAVASYMRSFHGKAALLGNVRTANCLSCHASHRSPHTILAQDQPESPVHPERIASTCSTIECHPGASPSFGAASVHWDLQSARGSIEYALVIAFILITALTFGPSAVLVVLELLQTVAGRVHGEDARLHHLTEAVSRHPDGRKRLVRFTIPQRIQHWLLAVLFIMLALTGFPMKFAETSWAKWMIASLDGLDNARMIHHWAGIALVLGFTGHLIHIMVVAAHRGRVVPSGGRLSFIYGLASMPMWIGMEDAKKIGHLLAYLLFLRSDRPKFGRFSIKEKFEYIGVFWGTVVLGITGIVLWGEQYASHLFDGRAFNVAAIFHTYEAFLAVIHVGIIHIHGVILSPTVFPLSPAMLSGRTPTTELAEGHAEYVERAAMELDIHPEPESNHAEPVAGRAESEVNRGY